MNKTVLITGASTGIGRETALYFQKNGWNVSATMRNPENLNIFNGLQNLICLKLDVTDLESIKSAVGKTIDHFKGLDVIVNNAGYSLMGPFEASTNQQIERQFNVNVFGVMNVIKEILPYFRNRKEGIIINVSSIGGKLTFPLFSAYQGTKFAIHGFSEGLQHELLQFNIKVKIIEPGVVKTDFYHRSMELVKNENVKVYDKYAEKIMESMVKTEKRGSMPIKTAKVIYKAATDNRWKMHYSSGSDAKMLLFLRWLLPTGIFNKILREAVK
jgi:NADP-dependent 3-hydroxy acid dehydrogenase YdfG